MIRKILIGLGAVLVIIQFIRPEKNDSNDVAHDIATKYDVPDGIDQVLQTSCNNCHSNQSTYPWYSNVQPVYWWLNHHITDGKRHLNFSSFTQLPVAVQNHKFEEIIEMVEEHKMPLPSYTYLGLHQEAVLTDEQRQSVVDWSKAQMDYLKSTYPADSLVMRRRR